MSEVPSTGVVAIGRNEGERLQRCLRSIPQRYPIVYVDSGSTDNSVDFAKSVGAFVVTLDTDKPFSAARARNEGAEALLQTAPGVSFIQFVDGDCEFEQGWIESAVKFLQDHPRVAVACGRRRERFPQNSFYNALADREWDTPIGEAEACGGDALYKREAFVEVDGFDSAMIAGEEPELCSRLRAKNWQVWRIDAPMTVHDADMHSFRPWWLRAVRSGFGYAQAYARGSLNGSRLYKRELKRALFWSVGVSGISVVASMFLGPLALFLAPLAWGAQWARLSLSRGPREAALLVVGKFAEAIGAGRFVMERLQGRASGAIFYK